MNPYFVLYTPSLENPEFAQFKGQTSFFAVQSKTKKLVANRDGDEIVFKGKFEYEELKKFVDDNALPYVPELSQETYQLLARKKIVTLVIDPKEEQTIKHYVQEMTEALRAAPAWTSNFSISWIDGFKWKAYIETFKPHTMADYPFILIIDPKDDKKYYSKLIKDKTASQTALDLINGIERNEETPKNKDEL